MKNDTYGFTKCVLLAALLLTIVAVASEIRALNETLMSIERDFTSYNCPTPELDPSVAPEPAEMDAPAVAYTVDDVTITHYCACEKCCGKWASGITAYGDVPTPGVTIAASPNFLPAGTRVDIGGHIYTVQDTGVSGKAIDIFCATHQEAIENGVYQASINILA